ncbi:MAG TPA: hypothetical protein VEL28_16440 [Candidatus Binatia bacterium]|nr:hypothetical protein [Candidatus Binatia bacterium]
MKPDRVFLFALTSLAAMAGMAAPAGAATCPGPVSGNIVLTDDYTLTSNGNCFIISGEGSVLDLNGHTITDTSWATSAITCTSPGITIKDTGTPKGEISGIWIYGIKNCENIQGIEMTGEGASWGVYNVGIGLHELSDSLIEADTYGLDVELKGGGSRITGNNVRADNVGISIRGNNEVFAAGPGIPIVEHNVVRDVAYTGIESATARVRVRSNMMYDLNLAPGGTCVDLPANTLYGGLQCECGAPYCEEEAVSPYDTFLPATAECPSSPITFIGVSEIDLTEDYDLAGDSGACLTIANGGTIDLNGHTITNSGAAGGIGIECVPQGGDYVVEIKDSGAVKGGIDGNLAVGIKNCAQVTDVVIHGEVGIGVQNTDTATVGTSLRYLRNSIIEVRDVAVQSRLYNRSSEVRNNFLRADETAIEITSMYDTSGIGKADLVNNLIRDSHLAAIKTTGTSTANISVDDNLMYKRDSSVTGSVCLNLHGSNTENHLLCNCATQCEQDDVPFTFPLLY